MASPSLTSSLGCVLFMFNGFIVLFCLLLLGFRSPSVVFSAPASFSLDALPPFYRSLVSAWRACNGFSQSSSLGINPSPNFRPAVSLSAKSVYSSLLSVNVTTPHCVVKFSPLFGPLYWPAT